MDRMTLLEVCVEAPDGIAAAVAGGANRIELCAALSLGGLTPSPGLVALATANVLPVMAMIRPHGGGFDYDRRMLAVMAGDITRVAALGVAGVVFGATRGRRLDTEALAMLMAHVRAQQTMDGRPLMTTLHRAIDLCADPVEAADQACTLGFDHILSSGAAVTAIEGASMLAAMQRRVRGRCTLIAAAGVTASNAAALIAATGVGAVHASCAVAGTVDPATAALGFGPPPRPTDAELVRALRGALCAHD
jgi:copper homeostasis protein